MKLSLAISPCPNDTFMFDAMINGRIDTEGLEFEATFADIEQLNSRLIESDDNTPLISKASYAIIPRIKGRYKALTCGSALGSGNGPVLVATDEQAEITDFEMRVAIPGENTTANMLLSKLYPHLSKKHVHLFSDIMEVLRKGECDAGVLIHEGRFVYHHHGMFLLADLGIDWERRTRLPLPLGAIVVSSGLPEDIQVKADRVLRRSIEYAMDNPEASADFVRSHASEMDSAVLKKHIDLFVNSYSIDIGDKGRSAVNMLLDLKGENIFVR